MIHFTLDNVVARLNTIIENLVGMKQYMKKTKDDNSKKRN